MLFFRTFSFICAFFWTVSGDFTKEEMYKYREKVRRMFYHAYNGYLQYAFPYDELKPISCEGADTWGSFSLTLIDALDTLIVMGNGTEFKRAVELVLANVNPEANVNVSVFETNIRVVGGLLTAHMLSGRVEGMQLEAGWPCTGPLLRLAEKMASKLLPAFNTDTGMPFGTVNLRYGVHKTETPITCTAGVGTFIVEFGTLSKLTGDPQYEKAALRALEALWKIRSPIGLVGNHVNVQTGVWTATDAGIGAGIDSYFEYLVKGAFLFQRPNLMAQFYEFEEAINKYVRHGDWFHWVSMSKGTTSLPIFQSLEAFWPGLLTMVGKVDDASRIMLQYSTLLKRYGMPPEFYHLTEQEPVNGRAAYPLRPEMAESLMYLYRSTDDPIWLDFAAQMVDAIEHAAKTRCGYATVNKVQEHSIEDRMESFFLAETTKYLYLIFDHENFLHNDGTYAREVNTTNGPCIIDAGGYIYNTEAHPIDPAIVHCCSANKQSEREALTEFERNIDFVSILHFGDTSIHTPKRTAHNERLLAKSDLPRVSGGSEYIKRHYGSDDLEFEVDESLRPNSTTVTESLSVTPAASFPPKSLLLNVQQILDRPVIRDFIRKARLYDEDNAKKSEGEKKGGMSMASALIALISRLAEENPIALSAENLDLETMRHLINKRDNAQRVRIAEARIQDACLPLDFIGDSAALRILKNNIFKNYLYPQWGIRFTEGPVCNADDAPTEWDNYSRAHPDNTHRVFTGDTATSVSRVSFALPEGVELAELQYHLLSAPIPGFISKFHALGFISPRNEKEAGIEH